MDSVPPLLLQMRKLSAFADRRITIDAITSELGISQGRGHSILHEDLNMHRVCMHMVPKMLSPEQRKTSVNMSNDLIDMTDKNDDFLKKIGTSDET
ncbi:uncharacterized protein TNCT_596231 [Trichonephila clavata]|uniref:Uncharacterized protein n=1 Tax=Trichonephila clavata TaxID=2740835 RepID=A0A8X6L8A6_TRICU|nr:uncharacterized protein TNCT_596231 [Trichonephila clavata]